MAYQNKVVAEVGSRYSAMQVVLDPMKLQAEAANTKIHWDMRSTNLERVLGAGEDGFWKLQQKTSTKVLSQYYDNGYQSEYHTD